MYDCSIMLLLPTLEHSGKLLGGVLSANDYKAFLEETDWKTSFVGKEGKCKYLVGSERRSCGEMTPTYCLTEIHGK